MQMLVKPTQKKNKGWSEYFTWKISTKINYLSNYFLFAFSVSIFKYIFFPQTEV